MTSVTQRAVCEHSLLIMQSMPYGLFSMQHGSFELSDSQTHMHSHGECFVNNVSKSDEKMKVIFFIIVPL